jgi:hypothetical protein
MIDKDQALLQAKEAAARVTRHTAEYVVDGWETFRSKSFYFQARAALVAAWVVVSLTTIVLVPPSVAPFVVERRDVSFGLANRTELLVVNEDGGDLDAVVEVTGQETDFDGRKLPPGTWATKPFSLDEGTHKTITTPELFDRAGKNPGYQLDVTEVRLLDDGDVVWRGVPTLPAPAKK